LIEIMIVVVIIAIFMTMGIPSMVRGLQKNDLARAVNDTIEGCKTARDRAILQGIPHEFIIQENGQMDVRARPPERRISGEEPAPTPATPPSSAPYAGFPRTLGEDVMVQLIDVNFINHMDLPEARVRFFPNGTSDEFTVVYAWKGKQRTVTVDIVTGQATEFIRD
jgi:type II secretory pathway pseudopilin PulG